MTAVIEDFPPTITDLAVTGDTVSWWQDAVTGSGLVSQRGANRLPAVTAVERRMWTVLTRTPGPGGWHAMVIGRPGTDHGYLSVVDGTSAEADEDPGSFPLVRRPGIVWAPDGQSFVYPRFGVGISPDQPPADGIEVAIHRIGTPFHTDEVLVPRQPAHIQVVLEPAAEPGRCLLRMSDGRRGDYYLLDHTGSRVPLVRNASARIQVVPAPTRWWVATDLGTERSRLLALPAGTLDRNRAKEITLRVDRQRVHPAGLRASRHRLAARAISGGGEHVVVVDSDTLDQHVVAGDRPGCTVSQLAASVTGSVIAWTEHAPLDGGGRRMRVRSLVDDADPTAVRTCVEQNWPAAAPLTLRWYRAADGARLPLYVSGDPDVTAYAPVVVMPHGGPGGLLTTPLERALERLCLAGELVVVRAVTRSPRRAYDDLLAGACKASEIVANGNPVALIGSGRGAVSAARAVLTEPELFRCVVLRYPVASLIRLPSSGRPIPPVLLQIGRFDTRAYPVHGRELLERLRREPGAPPELSEFAMGHIERIGCPEAARAVEETVRFIAVSG